jgi:hypothetical protein
MPVIEVEMIVPKGRLTWFHSMDKSSSPMEVQLGRHGNYRVFEAYCTDPRCECETAHLYLRKLDGEGSFRFDLNLKDFTPDSKFQSLEEKHRAAVVDFIKNLSILQKAALISHYRRAKEFGKEDPTSYLDFSRFEFGRYLAYEGVFGREGGEVFDLIHEDERYSIVDSYCLDPSCNCKTVVLSVHEPSAKNSGPAFLFQIKLDDQSWVGMKQSERAEKFFNERIRGNTELFAVLMERYHKMKELGRKVLKRYRKKEKYRVKFTPSGAHVPRIGEELVERMISCGLMVNYGLAAELLERREVVPSLIDILEDDRYWEPGGLGGGWGPIHAIHLLGAIKTDECLRALIKLIRGRGKDLGDWLIEDMPSILAGFGPRAVGPLEELVRNRGLDIFSRATAVRALAAIAHRHEEVRERVIELLRKVVTEEEEDPEFRSLAADDLAQFKHPGALADLKSLFDRGMIDETIVDWEGIERICNTPEERLGYRRDLRDPLDYFLPGNLRRLWEISYGKGPAHFVDAAGRVVHQEKPKKVGRNDPCPCGSGKKYKSCCWPREIGVKT